MSAILLYATLALVSLASADFVPEGSAAHFFSSQNPSLVFAPSSPASGAELAAAHPGDGSASDATALFPILGTGVPTQIVYGDWCITSRGVVPGSSTQTLHIADCDPDDAEQLWTVSETSPGTVSNADENCITLGRAAVGVPVTLAECTEALQHLQLWDPKPVS